MTGANDEIISAIFKTVLANAVAAPAAWNSLPGDVRSAPTLDKFKQCLKTHLFIQSYYS